MSIYIKSFEEIRTEHYKTDFLKNAGIYLAHTPNETFYEHNNLVVTYFIRLSEDHHLDEIVNKLIYLIPPIISHMT